MKRATDSPLLRGELDILQRRRRIKFPSEFSITPTNVGRLSAPNWIMKTKTACIGMWRSSILPSRIFPK
jgi:hypothetical protein